MNLHQPAILASGLLCLTVLTGGCSGSGNGRHSSLASFFQTPPQLSASDAETLTVRALDKDDDPEEVNEALVQSLGAGLMAGGMNGAELCCRACYWLEDYGREPQQRQASGDLVPLDCLDLVDQAILKHGNDPDFLYLRALILGERLRKASLFEAGAMADDFRSTLLRLRDEEPGIDNGAPLRLLGAFYLRAPAWPAGPGDLDTALTLLQEAAAKYPDNPYNHLFLAEALAKDGQTEKAWAVLAVAEEKAAALKPWRLSRFRQEQARAKLAP